MAELWFWLCALMVACYAAADGFDLGAGALHFFVGKSDTERRQVLAAIGPFWDGNEVWLLASGGALFLAFPKVLAASFSGLGTPPGTDCGAPPPSVPLPAPRTNLSQEHSWALLRTYVREGRSNKTKGNPC